MTELEKAMRWLRDAIANGERHGMPRPMLVAIEERVRTLESLVSDVDAALRVAWANRTLPASVMSGDLVRRLSVAANPMPEETRG